MRTMLVVPLCLLLASSAVAGTAAQAYALHGSGSSGPSPFLYQVLDMLTQRAKPGVLLTYRASGTGGGQSDFMGQPSTYLQPLNDFAVGRWGSHMTSNFFFTARYATAPVEVCPQG